MKLFVLIMDPILWSDTAKVPLTPSEKALFKAFLSVELSFPFKSFVVAEISIKRLAVCVSSFSQNYYMAIVLIPITANILKTCVLKKVVFESTMKSIAVDSKLFIKRINTYK